MNPRVSLLVVNFNRLELLKACLHSLRAQSHGSCEIVVVDNGSTDGSREYLSAQPPGLKLRLLDANLGFTGGNIAGLELCSGDYVGLVNNDAELDPGWVAAQLRALDAEPEAGCGASKVLRWADRKLLECTGGGMTTSGRGFHLGEGRPAEAFDGPRWAFWATAAAAMYRRSMLDQIGFLDPKYFFGCEDADLGFRAQLSGWKCLYVTDAVAYHHVNGSHSLLKGKADFYFSRNVELTWLKNMPSRLLWRYLHQHLLHEAAAAAKRLRRPKAALAFLLGKLAVLPLLPHVLRERRRIQSGRTLPLQRLKAMLTPAFGRAFGRAENGPGPLSASLLESLTASGIPARLIPLRRGPTDRRADRCLSLVEELGRQGQDSYLISDARRRFWKLSGNPDAPALPPDVGPLTLLAVPAGRLPLVCLLSHSGDLGGAERCLLEQAAMLAGNGVLCHVVLPAEGGLSQALLRLPVSLSLSPMPWWAWDDAASDASAVAGRVAASVDALAPDLRQVHPDLLCTRTCVIPQGGLLSRALGIPHLWQVDEYGERDHGLRFQLGEAARYAFIRAHSDLVAFHSASLRRHALSLDPDLAPKSVVLPYGLLPAPPAAPNAQRHFKRKGSLKLLLLGVIQPRKGQEDAVLAAALLIGQGVDLELVLAGPVSDPAYARRLEALAADPGLAGSVQILGLQKSPWPLLQESDVLLMCSRSEAFGRITVEAMLAAKPVIGLRAGATAELVAHGENGYLYEAGDIQGLAGHILRLAQDRGSLALLGAQGLRFAQSRYSVELNRTETLPLLRGLAKKRPRGPLRGSPGAAPSLIPILPSNPALGSWDSNATVPGRRFKMLQQLLRQA